MITGAVAACASATPESSDSTVSAVLGDPSPCAGVSIDATRNYKPKSWVDGNMSFTGGSLSFVIPNEIPVTAGAAGNGKVKLTFDDASGSITCVYRGNGQGAHHGLQYLFKKCKAGPDTSSDDEPDDADDGPADLLPTAGSTVSANTFNLHVVRGDKSAGPTTVHLSLPGPQLSDDNACTTDTCDPVTGAVSHNTFSLEDGNECTTDTCAPATGPAHTFVNTPFCRGKTNFHDRTLTGLGGNGRACSDCHMDSEAGQLSPAAAQARFAEMTASGEDDPLFRPIDAIDFRTNGAAATDYRNVTELALIRVTLPLPSNVKLLNCGSTVPCPLTAVPTTETVADVWRSVPSIHDVAITGPDGVLPFWPAVPGRIAGPNNAGGYQLDGRVDTLENQALGAFIGHASVTTNPSAGFLSDIAEFEKTQFSSAGVKALSDAMTAGTTPLPDPDPALDATEMAGKAVFQKSCAQCHGNATGHPSGTTPLATGTPGTPSAIARYFDIQVACPRPVDTVVPPRWVFPACAPEQMRNVRTYQITNSGVAPTGLPCTGAACITRVTTSDPGRLLLTGYPQPGPNGDINHMDVPPVRGMSRTAPYFSNNSAADIPALVKHYVAFFNRVKVLLPTAPILTTQPGVVPPVHDRMLTEADVPALIAYLNKI